MTLMDRYLARTVISGSLMVLLVLVALSSFFLLIGQANDIGHGSYGTGDALLYVLLNMPQQAYEMFPISVLLGSLLGLGQLASGNELMVLRAAGVSMARLAGSVLLGGLLLAILCASIGEMVAPPAQRYAQQMKRTEKYNRGGIAAAQGIWLRDGNMFVNIQQMTQAHELRDIVIYRLRDDGRLDEATHADAATYGDGHFQLHDLRRTRFAAKGDLKTSTEDSAAWHSDFEPDLFDLFVVSSGSLSTLELSQYIDYLRKNDLDASTYRVAFWTRIVTPVTLLVMVILSLPFVFGPLRSVGAGQRMVFGMLIGIGFYVVNKTLAHSGQVFGLSPILTAWVPTVLLAAATMEAVRRVR